MPKEQVVEKQLGQGKKKQKKQYYIFFNCLLTHTKKKNK